MMAISFYRAVDKHGQTIDFLLTEHRDKEAALQFLKKATRRNGLSETITMGGSDAKSQSRKRMTQPMLGFKAFDRAQLTLVGIEPVQVLKKRQLVVEEEDESFTAAALFYSLAA
jgi:transposase-like protein